MTMETTLYPKVWNPQRNKNYNLRVYAENKNKRSGNKLFYHNISHVQFSHKHRTDEGCLGRRGLPPPSHIGVTLHTWVAI